MDYFASFGKTFREQASAAASKARHLAENVTEKAQDFAQVASANAKVLAEKLKEDAKDLSEQSSWQEAAERAKTKFFQLSPFKDSEQVAVSKRELEAFGITSSYKDFVRSLDYSTFRDFDEKQLEAQVGFVKSEDGTSCRLNVWQERHAILALKVYGELDHLRYLLCPKRMTEEKFWLVYFSLAQPHLPEGCKTGILPELREEHPQETPVQEEPRAREKEETVSEQDTEDEDDDLDKYLNDVLHDDDDAATGASPSEDDFEDLDGYMEQLNAEMNSPKDLSPVGSDAEEPNDDAAKKESHFVPSPPAETHSHSKAVEETAE